MPWVEMSEITDDGRLFQIFTAAGRKALSKLCRVLAMLYPDTYRFSLNRKSKSLFTTRAKILVLFKKI